MENTELIKNFERIRDYMRQFYVFGFRSRSQMNLKSARSYDNERRRIESWLGEYMSFRREESGKQVFLSLDSRSLRHNPLFSAFKAKSFTDKDITLHFYILDVLREGTPLSAPQMLERMDEDYLAFFPEAQVLDISTLRKKLKEYEKLGLVRTQKQGRELLYTLPEARIELSRWRDALDYFSEVSPQGVIGSFLLDRLPERESAFRFKHHYLLHTLDSQILYQVLDAVSQQRWITVTLHGRVGGKQEFAILPCKIYISAQTGRQYVLGYRTEFDGFQFLRMDLLHSVCAGEPEERYGTYLQRYRAFAQKLWGVSTNRDAAAEHLEMVVTARDDEPHILQRLLREKRNGRVEIMDANTYRFEADVYDTLEMLPWIRTYIGRIVSLKCTNSLVTQRFHEDLEVMSRLYGGETDAVP